MNLNEFEKKYYLGGGNLLAYSRDDATLQLSVELIVDNQPSPELQKLRESVGEFLPATITVQTDGIVEGQDFVGFAPSQDGEISNFGLRLPAAAGEGKSKHDLAFFLHDYSRKPGTEDFIVIGFEIRDITIQIGSGMDGRS